MKNTPPERLAKIEYKSHLYQAFGISFVCILLISKGLWYIIFAFIFGLGISYSQGITAYQKYRMIMSLKSPERIEDYEKDISPTRRRNKIIKSIFPPANWFSIISSVIITLLIIDPHYSRWLLMILYPITIGVFYIFFYFFVFYWICYPFYRRRIKLNGK